MMTDQPARQPDGTILNLPTRVQQVHTIAGEEFGRVAPRLEAIFTDVADLYAGRWPSHEACEVRYHNFSHALDVSLAIARMLAGWNRSTDPAPFSESQFHIGIAAALFHDSGYIKEKGDHQGSGGKFTRIHVARSMEIARTYLTSTCWQPDEIDTVVKVISITDYAASLDPALVFGNSPGKTLAQMMATADLLAQMADADYIQRIDDLFSEFKESYEFEDAESLAQNGTRVYENVQELRNGTIAFYEHFVVPTLKRFGNMDRYLIEFFGKGRNPYKENIAANLSSQLLDIRTPWRRLGDILKELGIVSTEQIDSALSRQKQDSPPPPRPSIKTVLGKQLLPWFAASFRNGKSLGNILMEMDAVSPKALARGLLTQILPESLLADLDPKGLRFLLQAASLLQSLSKGPWILEVIMEMTNEILECEASSILIADLTGTEIQIALPTGPKKKILSGKKIPLDRGIAGWVYQNRIPATVNNTATDVRFDSEIDQKIGFLSRSILAVPLYLNGECIGVLEALNKKDDTFTRQDRNILSILANLFANGLDSVSRQEG